MSLNKTYTFFLFCYCHENYKFLQMYKWLIIIYLFNDPLNTLAINIVDLNLYYLKKKKKFQTKTNKQTTNKQ